MFKLHSFFPSGQPDIGSRESRTSALPTSASGSLVRRFASLPNSKMGAFGLGCSLIVVVLIAGGAMPSSPVAADRREPTLAEVSPIRVEQSSSYEVEREFVGRVESRRASSLSFELGGLVSRVLVDEGDPVNRGDVIATLDTQLLTASLDSLEAEIRAASSRLAEMEAGPRHELIAAARADVARWQAEVQLAEATQDRHEQLVGDRAVSRQALDDATFGEQTVRANLAAAEARYEELINGTRREKLDAQRALVERLVADRKAVEIKLVKANVVAPFSGIIAERYLDEGTVVETGTPVVRLLETAQLDVRLGVSEDALRSLSPTMVQSVEINGQQYRSQIRSIRPDRDLVTRTVSVLLELESESHTSMGDSPSPSSRCPVVVGDLATVRFRQRVLETGFWVPMSALTESYRGLWACYVLESSGSTSTADYVIRSRQLEVIHQEAGRAYVRGGLRDADLVVRQGLQRLVPNQRVVIRPGSSRTAESELAQGSLEEPIEPEH